MSSMRALLEAVTDFLGRYGADHESTSACALRLQLTWRSARP